MSHIQVKAKEAVRRAPGLEVGRRLLSQNNPGGPPVCLPPGETGKAASVQEPLRVCLWVT